MKSVIAKQVWKQFLLLAFLVTTFIPVGTTTVEAASARVDNPFVGATQYVNPDYANLIDTSIARVSDSDLKAKMETVKKYPTAVWLDRIAAIYGGAENGGRKSLEQTLDEVLTQKQGNTPIVATFVIYDLPGRDCHALASNGELPLTAEGLQRYKTEYIDVIASIFAKPKYQDIRIVNVIEPDSLPNLVTNLNTPACAAANSTNIYKEATQYALNKLYAIPNTYNYMDIGHSGWLGWDTNMGPAINLFTSVVAGTDAGLASVHGFITNTANTTPLVEPNLPDANLNINGQPLRSADYYEWNPYFDEIDFTAALYSGFVAKGWPSSLGFLIDTSRNGWGGPDRPTGASGSTPTAYADSGRVDKRLHRGNWCNASGAGIGEPPQVAPTGYASSHIDAFVWVKPPGESDGSSSEIPNNEGKGFDRMCDPTYTTVNGTLTGAMANAPVSGHWFHEQFVQLVENAYPVIPGTPVGNQAPAAPALVSATAGNAQVNLTWSASPGATSYTVKSATTSGGPYTTVATVAGTSYTHTGLTNGTTYYYVVSAANAVGSSANSLEASAQPVAPTTPTAPAAPSTLTATAGDAKVTLGWSASAGAASYNVKRATTSAGPFTTLTNTATTSYVDTTAVNGTTYYYVVSAVNSAGESVNSVVAHATPTAPPVTPAGDLVVQYRAGDTNATDNQIKPQFNIKNNGTTAVNLSDLKIRYYFTKDGATSVSAWIDWAQIGGSNITATFGSTSGTNADTYVELSFSAAAGSIPAGGQTGDIQLRMSKSDWSNFNEANDYSFDPTKTAYTDWNKVTLYQGSTLVWGIEP